jgi:hypothetical protein
MSSLSNWMSEYQQKAELLVCVSQLFVANSFNGRGDVERFGIGLYLGVLKDSGFIFANNVRAGSPACTVNIEVGHVLLEIEREKVQPRQLVSAQVRLFGYEKHIVSLKLLCPPHPSKKMMNCCLSTGILYLENSSRISTKC